MLYLLDTNVLIDANRDYYPLKRLPEFWEWLHDCAVNGQAKVPLEIYYEVLGGNKDELTNWLRERKEAIVFNEEVDSGFVGEVSACYAPDLSDIEIEKIGQDAFLIAYALRDPKERVVVTTEVSKPSRKRANRHVPDVCQDLTVPCCDTFELVQKLNFRTDWQNQGGRNKA